VHVDDDVAPTELEYVVAMQGVGAEERKGQKWPGLHVLH
jgi:hypothetical protein